jgi:hypothetical protein
MRFNVAQLLPPIRRQRSSCFDKSEARQNVGIRPIHVQPFVYAQRRLSLPKTIALQPLVHVKRININTFIRCETRAVRDARLERQMLTPQG